MCQVAQASYLSPSKDWTYKALKSLVPSQLRHILNFKHTNSHSNFNGSVYMLKVKCVCLSVLLERGQSTWWLAVPRSDLLPNPVQGFRSSQAGFGRDRQDPAGQEPAHPSSPSEVLLCIHWGGFALVTYIIRQTSGGWIRQSDIARWDDGVKKLLQLACPSLRLSVI